MLVSFSLFLSIPIVISLLLLFLPLILILRLYSFGKPNSKKVIGIFHPYSNGGGGGERVMWCIVKALQECQNIDKYKIVLYTGDYQISVEGLRQNVKRVFNIYLTTPIEIVPIRKRDYIETMGKWKFSLIMQSIATMILGWEAISQVKPDIFIETMGCAFIYPMIKLLIPQSKVICYVHYPTISTDMLQRVSQRISTYNNDSDIAKSTWKTKAKVFYYQFFANLYGFAGYFTDYIMVNSSWTFGHIKNIWLNTENKIQILYPPVNVSHFQQLSLDIEKRKPHIISIGQFRPEKDHPLQLRSFAQLLSALNDSQKKQVKLILLGGCRGAEDEKRVNQLKQLSKELEIDTQVEFVVNAPFEKLSEYCQSSIIGLHTMWNEHFGIGVVEYMAAGLITIAHRSGGPKADIVVPAIVPNNDSVHFNQAVGLLAQSKDEFAVQMKKVLDLYFENGDQLSIMQQKARQKSKTFSEEKFADEIKLSKFIV